MSTPVKYFGLIAEELGKTDEVIVFNSTSGELDLQQYFEDRYPSLKKLTYKIAVNQEFCTHLDTNSEISEISLLPPFAGG